MGKEIWKDVKGYEGYYQISDLGNLKSSHRNSNKLLTKNKHHSGYLNFTLSKNKNHKSVSAHRLVAEAFISNPKNKSEVNHIDGDKTNNNVSNLEWNTRSENQKHAFKIGLNRYHAPTLGMSGYLSKTSKIVIQMDINCNMINEFGSTYMAQRLTGVNSCNISMCANGKRITAGGYKWKYKENL